MALNVGSMGKGWRFSPTDEEFITDFLKQKNEGLLPDIPEIPVIDVCKFEPWELPSKSLLGSNDLQWFFFSPCECKNHRGHCKNRTREGYWKATGKDRNIKSRSSKLIGKKRTLVFYQGCAPNGKRTNWVMHEYQQIENVEEGRQGPEGVFVICCLKTKSDESSYWNSGNQERSETSSVFSSVDSHVREALQSTVTPSDQVTLNSSRMQAGKMVAGEQANAMLFPPVLQKEQGEENHVASFSENHEDALELQFLVEACHGTDCPQSISPLTSCVDECIGQFCPTSVKQDRLCMTAMNTSFLETQADMTVPASNDVHGYLLDSPSRERRYASTNLITLDEEPDMHPIRFLSRKCNLKQGSLLMYHSCSKSDSDEDSDETTSWNLSPCASSSSPPSESYQRIYFKDPTHSVNQKFLVKSKDYENETGIKIRRRQRTYHTNLSKCVDQGTAPRRVLSLQKIRDRKVSDSFFGLSDNADDSEIKSAAPGGWIDGEAVMSYMYEEQEGSFLSEVTRRLRSLEFAEKSQNR